MGKGQSAPSLSRRPRAVKSSLQFLQIAFILTTAPLYSLETKATTIPAWFIVQIFSGLRNEIKDKDERQRRMT
jgi:hypothetical protein